MADVGDGTNFENAAQAISQGKRHLLVRDYCMAVSALAKGCAMLAAEHGEMADELGEPFLLYGRSLLCLSREEAGVLGSGVPGTEGEGDGEGGEKADDEDGEEGEGEEGEEGDEEEQEKSEDEETAEGADAKTDGESSKEKKSEEKTETPAAAEKMNGEASSSKQNGEVQENGEDDAEDVDNEDDDEANSNLQLAWEVLELAKLILLKRGPDGWKLLAEAHRLLGEVAMESGNQTGALTDLNACLDLLRKIEPADPRSMAETHYQLGLAHSLGNEFDESIQQFQEATSLLEARIKELESQTEPPKSDDPFYTVESEIKELKELLPEIQDKITDMRDFKQQACKLVIEGIKSRVASGSCSNGAGPSGEGSSSSSAMPKPASDISHLVRKKRKPEDEEAADPTLMSPAKKPTPEKAA